MTHLSNKKLLVILLCTGLCGLFAAFFITAQNNALQMASDTTNEVFSALNITSADTNGNTTELIDAASDSLEEVSESLASSEDSILKSLNTIAYTTTDSYKTMLKSANTTATQLYDDSEFIVTESILNGQNVNISGLNNSTITDTTFKGEGYVIGVMTLKHYKASTTKTIELPYQLLSLTGSTKLVLVDANSNVTTLIESVAGSNNPEHSGTLKIQLLKGDNILKLVGKNNATFTISLKYPKDEQGAFESTNE